MKKNIKIPLIILGSLVALVLVVNIGFSIWLKYQLPDYLKNKTPYQISYQSLNVDVFSGGISAKQVKIKTKHPEDLKVTAIDGNLESLTISRLGVIELLKNKVVKANSVKLVKPNISVRLAVPKQNQANKNPQPVIVENIDIDQGNINIKSNKYTLLFAAKNLDLNISKIIFNQKQDDLPFAIGRYNITANDFYLQLGKLYALTCSSVKTKDGKLDISNFKMKSVIDFKLWQTQFKHQKSLYDIESDRLSFDALDFGKSKLSFKNANILNPVIVIKNREENVVKNNAKTSDLNVDFQNITIKNGGLKIVKSDQNKSLSLNRFDANIKNVIMDSETKKNKIPFTYEDFNITGNGLFMEAGKYYTMNLESFRLAPKAIDIKQFKLIPKYSRSEFVKMIPMENDLFDISAQRIHLVGLDWKFENDQPNIAIKNAKLSQVDANIFRSKIPKDNPKEKPLYSKLLRSLKFPLLVDNFDLIDSKLVYEEDKPDTNGPGKVFFTHFNMNVKNINSNKHKGANTRVPIVINCKFMDASPMHVNWNFDTANFQDRFSIAGYINQLPAKDINPFIKPYMNITATGTITALNFDFNGNNDVMKGKFRIKHQDLKVSVLDKDTKKKKNFLSAIANLVVKKDSEKFPESVDIDVKRSKDRSFFNFYWKGIEDGLKKSLLVIKI